ncbi:hypothetical protein D3C71_1313330 [compost metagenome]
MYLLQLKMFEISMDILKHLVNLVLQPLNVMQISLKLKQLEMLELKKQMLKNKVKKPS